MPRGDKMGPGGQGPMTGRRMGYCTDNDTPAIDYPGRGMGYGRGMRGRGMQGRGMGRCMGGAYPVYAQAGYAPISTYVPDPAEEQRYLEQRAKLVESDLEDIKKRIQELKGTEE